MSNIEKVEFARKIIYNLDQSTERIINDLKLGVINSNYFEKIGFAKNIYSFFGYDLSESLYKTLLEEGLIKTHLSLEDIEIAVTEGKNKSEFFLNLYKEGREFIDKQISKRKIVH